MKELKGRSVSSGIAIGKLCFLEEAVGYVPEYEIEDTEAELVRYRTSRELAKAKMQSIYDSACKRVTKKESVIFQTHMMILEDSKFVDLVEAQIAEGKNAEYAVFSAGEKLAKLFKSLDDEYFKARYTDIIDAANVLLLILQHKKERTFRVNSDEPIIIVADDLMPSDTVAFNNSNLLGYATNNGSVNAHAAILARTMGLPSVIQLKNITPEDDGKTAIIDAQVGKLIIDPDVNTLALYHAKKERFLKQQERLKRQVGLPSKTKNGQYIRLSADISRLDSIEKAKSNDAEGIGIFRSEYIFMNRALCPDENEQFQVYKTLASSFAGKPVVIATANGGSEKGMDYLDIPKEKNPAIGFRGIRISLENPEFLRIQLRALYRAAAYGNISILLPMVTSLEEIEYVKRQIEKVKAQLKLDGIKYGENVRLGCMIDTPAAAVICSDICHKVDFIMIDTDSLAQYTLAMDSDNPKLQDFYRIHHPAVKRLISYTIKNARTIGTYICVCGELAYDTALTKSFLSLDVDELVMLPSKLLSVKAAVRETDTSEKHK